MYLSFRQRVAGRSQGPSPALWGPHGRIGGRWARSNRRNYSISSALGTALGLPGQLEVERTFITSVFRESNRDRKIGSDLSEVTQWGTGRPGHRPMFVPT